MSENIEWTKVPKNAKIVDNGASYTWNGKLIYWSSGDAGIAQQFLASRAVKKDLTKAK